MCSFLHSARLWSSTRSSDPRQSDRTPDSTFVPSHSLFPLPSSLPPLPRLAFLASVISSPSLRLLSRNMSPSPSFTIRPALPPDAPHILSLIRSLAAYEKEDPSSVQATEALIKKNCFEEGGGVSRALLVEVEGEREPVGMALYFFNFSTCAPISLLFPFLRLWSLCFEVACRDG